MLLLNQSHELNNLELEGAQNDNALVDILKYTFFLIFHDVCNVKKFLLFSFILFLLLIKIRLR